MMSEGVRHETLPCGLTVLVESMPAVRSAAFSLLIPGGCIYDPVGGGGSAALLSDLMTRGAGGRSSRELSDELDGLGLHRSEAAGWSHLSLSGACVADRFDAAFEVYADVVQRPALPEEEFAPAVEGLRQQLQAIEDEPQRKIGIELRRRIYEDPWGRPSDGSLDDLPRITHASIRQHFQEACGPQEAVLAVAGAVEFEAVRDRVNQLFGDWKPRTPPATQSGPRGARLDHLSADSAQTHLTLAYDSVPYRDADYYAAWACASILGGGSSSRLFTEVREHRGLCYSVYATTSTTETDGRVVVYAGSTNERAQETLDQILDELIRLPNDLKEDELRRCKAQAKSSLVMAQESSSSRASSLARDWRHLGRVRSLDEVRDTIEALTLDDLRRHLRERGRRNLTLLTIGPESLDAGRLSEVGHD